MRLTSSFAVFRYDPREKRLAKARWLGREGRIEAAEHEYRAALGESPDLAAGWLELFEMLRRNGRHADALATATQAAAHFGPDAAMPLALRGAALAEMGRTRDAVRALEAAIERDGNLALAWHELAYAAFRAGESSRALLALDRAFMLEPHTDTLMLRGRILREAGQYDAAEVAFEAAQQSAGHDIPRSEAEREIAATRRMAALGPKRPRDFTYRERAFAESGCVLLDDGSAPVTDAVPEGVDALTALLTRCLATLPLLAAALDWRPAAVTGAEPEDAPLALALAHALGASAVGPASLGPGQRPLIVTAYNHGGASWRRQLDRLDRWRAGYAFALMQGAAVAEASDVAGTLRGPGDPATARRAATAALGGPTHTSLEDAEVVALARNPLARWRSRVTTA